MASLWELPFLVQKSSGPHRSLAEGRGPTSAMAVAPSSPVMLFMKWKVASDAALVSSSLMARQAMTEQPTFWNASFSRLACIGGKIT